MTYPFIGAANYTPANRVHISLLVLHSMESQEKPGTARRVAEWFASEDAPMASAHYCVDDREVIQCVMENNVAWHAPGVNAHSIGIEHAGRAAQTRDQWLDEFGLGMMRQSTMLAADLCERWRIAPVYVDADGLRAQRAGITTHFQVSLAFRRSVHWDPGPSFPLEWYIERVKDILNIQETI